MQSASSHCALAAAQPSPGLCSPGGSICNQTIPWIFPGVLVRLIPSQAPPQLLFYSREPSVEAVSGGCRSCKGERFHLALLGSGDSRDGAAPAGCAGLSAQPGGCSSGCDLAAPEDQPWAVLQQLGLVFAHRNKEECVLWDGLSGSRVWSGINKGELHDERVLSWEMP